MKTELLDFSLDRMLLAVEKVRERLIRATEALNRPGVAYAVVGGNAVAVWVARVDVSAVRNTRDVDVLVRREDFNQVKAALAQAGFVQGDQMAGQSFDDLADNARNALKVYFEDERANLADGEEAGDFRVLSLPALVRIKLTAFRDKDRTHLRDMIDVGLIDASWLDRLPTPLAARLKSLIDTPNG